MQHFSGRILALDVGEKTIGVAFSDESQQIALPGQTLMRQEGWRNDMAALRAIIAEQSICEIVVGMPLLLDGSQGAQAEKVQAFIQRLRGSVRIPIHTQDERMSTGEAEHVLRAAGQNRQQRKEVVDSLAATLILQTFLARKQNASLASTDAHATDGQNEEAV